MPVSPEILEKLRSISARVELEQDRDKFNLLVMELMAVLDEMDRQDLPQKPYLVA